MDQSLFERTVNLHGVDLERLIKEEQGANFLVDVDETSENVTSAPSDEDNPSSTLAQKAKDPSASTSMKHKVDRRRSKDKHAGSQFTSKLHSFIARKADLLFNKPADNDAPLVGFPSETDAEKSDYYAILPPLEQFLEVRPDISQERLFGLLKVGDVVIGQILSTKEFGIFVKLLALCQGASRFLEECEVVAFLPAGELRDKFSHVASVDDFQIGDLIRALVIKVNAEEQKVIISLHAREELKDNHILGLITETELPVHYRRSVLQLDTQEIYQDMLHNTVGFDNPFNVAYLGAKLGLNDTCSFSLMRGLQRSNFPEKEYAAPLRKWQTNRWSMESVAKGVEYFKAGKLLDAMQHLNKALEIDEENVEALVARGALYANKDLLSKALQDFGQALKINPNHRNANKYMCQTLIERGKQHEEVGATEKAADCYQTAIDIKPDFLEAQLCLSNINRTRTPAKRVDSPESISSSSPKSPGATHISVEALRQLVQPDEDGSQPLKKSVEKTKKKKKKKGKEKDKLYRKRDLDERHSRERQKSDRKKRKLSSTLGNRSSDSSKPSRSRSRSLHSSGKKGSRDERKLVRSTSKKGKKDVQRHERRSRHSASYSWSSSSDSSSSQTLRSRSRGRRDSGRKSTKREGKRRGRRAYYSQSSSSDSLQSSRSRSRNWQLSSSVEVPKSSSSKRDLQVVKHRSGHVTSRSLSDSESSDISVSPTRLGQSKPSSLDRSKRKSSRDERSRERTSRKETKAAERSQSTSLSPRSRHRRLSQDSRESRSSKTDSVKKHSLKLTTKKVATISDIPEKESIGSRSKIYSTVGLQQLSRTKSRDKSPIDEQFRSKQRKTVKSVVVKSPLRKRELDVKQSSDVIEASQRLENSKEKRDAEDFDQGKLNKDNKHKEETSRHSKETKSDSRRSSLNSIPGKIRDGVISKEHGSSFQDTKTQGKRDEDRKSQRQKGCDDHRSRSRSSSSDGSYSDRSYTSYSLSGSRSYSYSSYSSSGSYSDSDDSSYFKKNSGNKPDKSSRLSMKGKSGTSELRKKEDKQRDDDKDSDSDIDTGIYEISRDHLEMYMDSKSYQVKKVDDNPTPRGKKRWRSDDEDEMVGNKKSKAGKENEDNSHDDKGELMESVLFPAAYKESQKTAKSVSESPLDLETTVGKKYKVVSSHKDGTKIPFTGPPQSLPARNQDVNKSVKEDDFSHTAYIQSSVQNIPFNQLLEPHLGHQQPVVSDKGSILSTVPDMDPHQPRVPDVHEGPSQSLEHQTPQLLIKNESISQQNPVLHGNVIQSSVSKTDSQELNFAVKPDRDVQDISHTISDATANKFTPEQLSVIELISKQLAHAHQETSHVMSSGKTYDTEASENDQRHLKGQDVIRDQRLSDVTKPAQEHRIGVIMTPRSSNGHEQSDVYPEMVSPQSLGTTNPSFNDRSTSKKRGRWDVKTSDKDWDKGHEIGHLEASAFPLEDDKPVPVSFDYQHGQDIGTSSDASININVRELQEKEEYVSDRPGGAAYDQPESTSIKTDGMENTSIPGPHHKEKHGRHSERDDVLGVVKRSTGRLEHSHRESVEMPAHGSGHSSRGERSHYESPRGHSSEGGTHYSTRHDRAEDKGRNVSPNLSATKFQVVDYQHGRSDRHHERSRVTSGKAWGESYEDRHHDRHRDDHHRTSFEQQHGQSEHRSSYKHRSDDRRTYHDRESHQSRETHRDRYHRRSSDTHSGRTHSRTQGSGTPVQPKESNPFFQTVSSSKEMQVASLHSEGKWGHDSPEEAKSSFRTWWV